MAKKPPSNVKEFFREQLPPDVLEFFKKQGAKGGKLGGSKAWEGLTPEERSARAKKAVAAREAKKAGKSASKGARPKKSPAKKGK